MAASSHILPSPLAKDLLSNPVPCGVTPHPTHTPATLILEAVVPVSISDHGRLWWLTCSDIACLADAQRQADSYCPTDTDLRDATCAEIEDLSGIDVRRYAALMERGAAAAGSAS